MAITVAAGQDTQVLYGNFAFYVQFEKGPKVWDPRPGRKFLGAFSEISGIVATMEHKVFREGGYNYGSRMLAGPVNFGTVILKRGIVRSQLLWQWWAKIAGADGLLDGNPATSNRCDILIGLLTGERSDKPASDKDPPVRRIATGWKLTNAMPVKFRVGDLNAKGSDVAIEELHLVHEGLHVAGVVRR
jgi:phage tail-like protein